MAQTNDFSVVNCSRTVTLYLYFYILSNDVQYENEQPYFLEGH